MQQTIDAIARLIDNLSNRIAYLNPLRDAHPSVHQEINALTAIRDFALERLHELHERRHHESA